MLDIAYIVRRAQNGDERGRNELFEIASRLAYAKISETIGYGHDADDVLQEVLFSLMQSLPELREPRAFLKWFKRIVSNKLADYFRKKSRSREISHCDPQSIEHGVREKQLESADRDNEIKNAVMTVIKQLPPRNRLIVRLFYFEGLSCREIADFLFTSSQAIKTDLWRIRRTLNKHLKKMAINSVQTDDSLTFQWINIGGDKIAGKLFEPDSPEARIYLAAYPISTVSAASSTAGVPEDEVREILKWWEKYELIELEGNQIRCLFPVLLSEDYDLLLPWAERVAGPLIEQLERLSDEALALGKGLPDKNAQESVRVTSLLAALNAGWDSPLMRIFKEAKLKWPERMGLGRVTMGGAAGIKDLPQGFNGEIHLFILTPDKSKKEVMARSSVFAFIHPVGTTRKIGGGGGYENKQSSAQKGYKPLGISVLSAVLSRVGRKGVDMSTLEKILREILPSGVNKAEWMKDMVDSQALVEKDGKVGIGIPVISLTAWKKFTAYLNEVSGCVRKSLEDSAIDLDSRFAKCSFVHCNYTECLLLALTLVSNLMFERIKKTCAVVFPEKADFSWGTFIALP